MTKVEKYLRGRLEGLGTREAARRAGYRQGVPSPRARRVWKKIEALQEQPDMLELLGTKVRKQAERTQANREWLYAGRFV